MERNSRGLEEILIWIAGRGRITVLIAVNFPFIQISRKNMKNKQTLKKIGIASKKLEWYPSPGGAAVLVGALAGYSHTTWNSFRNYFQ